jgi:cytochrome c-type biogenesis protein CcmH
MDRLNTLKALGTPASTAWTRHGLLALLLAVLLAALPNVLLAQDAAPAATVSPNDVNDVARELWCPLCSGVRLDACELKACDQMKDVIAEKLAAGEDTQNIKNYFVAQYGPQVLGEPPLEGFNWLAWLLPVAVLIAGGFFVWQRTRQMMRTPEPAGQAGAAAGASSPVGGATGSDTYSRKLEEELKHYD